MTEDKLRERARGIVFDDLLLDEELPRSLCETLQIKIITALQRVRDEEREACARVAETHCRYVTRLCCVGKEEICKACEIAAAIRNQEKI